jgi:RNA polymerase sigma factor (sigma-70 family)
MSQAASEFAALLARARQGDAAALAALARQYEPEVRIIARVLLGPALRPYLDSMDLVQSVHRSLMLGLRQEKFHPASPEQLVSLALTMVRRKVARQWRRHRRQQRLRAGAGDGASVADLLASLCSPDADPARAAQLSDAVRHLCANLDETERQIMALRLEGYSTIEVARQLGLDADVLRVRLSRLRQRLRAAHVLDEWL